MTISPFIIYLWGIADQLHSSLTAATIFCGLFCIASAFAFLRAKDILPDDSDVPHRFLKTAWRLGIASLCFFIASSFAPSSKTIALMVVVPAIVNSEPIQKDAPELYRMAIEAAKQQLMPTPEKK